MGPKDGDGGVGRKTSVNMAGVLVQTLIGRVDKGVYSTA